MVEVIATEFRDLRDLLNASKTVSGTVVGYRYGEIRVYGGIAYIPISIGRGVWYVLYTKNFQPIDDDTEAIEFTFTNDIRKVSAERIGEDPKSIYFLVIRPIQDDVVKPLLDRVK